MLTRRAIQAVRPFMRVARLSPAPATGLQIGNVQSRLSSDSSKPKSPTSSFYKTFSRPIAKVLLVAMLTYQMIYLGWVKLEADETKAVRNAEIGELEAKVKELQGEKKS